MIPFFQQDCTVSLRNYYQVKYSPHLLNRSSSEHKSHICASFFSHRPTLKPAEWFPQAVFQTVLWLCDTSNSWLFERWFGLQVTRAVRNSSCGWLKNTESRVNQNCEVIFDLWGGTGLLSLVESQVLVPILWKSETYFFLNMFCYKLPQNLYKPSGKLQLTSWQLVNWLIERKLAISSLLKSFLKTKMPFHVSLFSDVRLSLPFFINSIYF